jgi:hypothetical protein
MGRLRGLFFKEESESDAAIYPIDRGGNMMGVSRVARSSPSVIGRSEATKQSRLFPPTQSGLLPASPDKSLRSQ